MSGMISLHNNTSPCQKDNDRFTSLENLIENLMPIKQGLLGINFIKICL